MADLALINPRLPPQISTFMDSYIFFTYTNRNYWWVRFLRPGFSHCYLLIKQDVGYVCVEMSIYSMEVNYYPSIREFKKTLDKTTVVIKNYTDVNLSLPMPFLRPFTCVEVVKRVLGIKRWTIFTPYQLYRYLK